MKKIPKIPVLMLVVNLVLGSQKIFASCPSALIVSDYPEEYKGHVTAYERRMTQLSLTHPHPDIIFRQSTEAKSIALTFDDGPDNKITPLVLNVLKEFGIPATFFFLGQNITDTTEDVVLRAKREGHVVASHGWDHRRYRIKIRDSNDFTPINPEAIKEDIDKGMEALRKTLGEEPVRFMRPPYGDLTPEVMTVFGECEVTPVLWSLDTADWVETVDATTISDTVIRLIHPGAIILMHSRKGQEKTCVALRDIIIELLSQGYTFVHLMDLLKA